MAERVVLRTALWHGLCSRRSWYLNYILARCGTYRYEHSCYNSRSFHVGRGHKLETRLEPTPLSDSPPLPIRASKPSSTREELESWHDTFEQERKDLLNASFLKPENGSDYIREQFNLLMMPPRYVPNGDLPKNFYGEDKATSSRGYRGAQVGDVMVSIDEGLPICAVLARRCGENQDLYYDMNGNVKTASQTDDSVIVLSGRIEAREILPLLSYLPPSPGELRSAEVEVPKVPGGAGIYLRRHLAEIRDEIQDAINADFEALGSMWDVLAHETEIRTMTLEDMAVAVFKTSRDELSPARIGAMFCFMLQSFGPFIHDRIESTQLLDSQFNVAVTVISRQDVALFQQVKAWYQEYRDGDSTQKKSSVFGKFIRYSRSLILNSRARRQPLRSGLLGAYDKSASLSDPNLDGLTDKSELIRLERPAEQWHVDTPMATIMRYLKRMTKLKIKGWPSFIESESNIVPTLMRATKLYAELPFTGALFDLYVREMGLLPPWVDPESSVKPFWKDPYKDNDLNELVHTGVDRFEGHHDTLQNIRKDWGNMEVFCIDSTTTEVIDDGFSLEPIANDPQSFWIHVHIANPTAFMDFDDSLAVAARKRVATVYAVGRHNPMFPNAVSQRCSLQADRPTLTFSAKVHQNGEISETNITPGYIRNVTRLSPSVLDGILGFSGLKEGSFKEYVVGDRAIAEQYMENESRVSNVVSQETLGVLSQLHKLARAIKGRQGPERIDAFRARFASSSLQIAGMDGFQLTEDEPYRPSDDPTIIFRTSLARVKQGAEYVHPDEASQMVETFMELANEMAGGYCAERNIPVMFTDLKPDPGLPELDRYYQEFFQSIPMNRALVRDLSIRAVTARRGTVMRSPSPGQNSDRMQPTAHATSPLRRYADLFTHFQIQRSLQLEAVGYESKIRFEHNDSRLPCTFDQLNALLPYIQRNSQFWVAASTLSNRQWFHHFVNRALRFGEDPSFPRYLEVMVHRHAHVNAHAFSPLLGRFFPLAGSHPDAPHKGYFPGERWLAGFSDHPLGINEVLYPIVRLGWEFPEGYRPVDELPSDLPDYTSFASF